MADVNRIRLGIAGWVYEPWRGEFYPAALTQKQELAYASARLGVIEINATFRANQKPSSFQKWAAETPEGFVFSVKGPQLVTHIKRLKDVEGPLANFFASGPLALGSRLGPFVWQLPPGLKYEEERMRGFLELLPKNAAELAAFGARHDERQKSEPFLSTEATGPIRHAIEVRHESFVDAGFLAMLRQHNVALVTADTAEWPYMDTTADFAYCRLQGPPGGDRYDEAGLDLWAARLQAMASGNPVPDAKLLGPADHRPREVLALFVSTDKEHAPRNARSIMARLGLHGMADAG